MNLIMQTIPSTLVSELLANSDLDGIILDTEHGCFNNETLYSCIQVINLSNKKCFVRFTTLDKQLVRICLDAGIDGVIFSTVEHVEYAHKIIEYCNYPSKGGKRGCGLVRENMWGKNKLDQKKPIIIGQIETRTAIEKIRELYDESNLDFFILGPYDISSSLQVAGDFTNEIYLNYLDKVYSIVPKDKLGIFVPYEDYENNHSFYRKNHNILILGLDTDLILNNLNKIRK